MAGHHLQHSSIPRNTSLLGSRTIAQLHRLGLARRTMGDDAVCSALPEPFLPKTQYQWSVFYPVAEANSKHPTGRSTLRWGENRMILGIGEGLRLPALALAGLLSARGLLRMTTMKPHLSTIAAFLIIGMTLGLLHADEFDEAAIDGGNFATSIFPDATVDADGNVTIGGVGEEGDVIDVVDETNARDRGDLSNDPFLDAIDDVFGSIDELGREFGACSTTREVVPTIHVAALPEERFCERIRKVDGTCRITHRIEIERASGTIAADVWEPPECMVGASHTVGPSVCRGEITLVEGAALGQCLEIGGRTICLGDPLYGQLTPPPFDGHEQRVSRLALAVDVGPLDCNANLEALPCITTSTGRTVCPVD